MAENLQENQHEQSSNEVPLILTQEESEENKMEPNFVGLDIDSSKLSGLLSNIKLSDKQREEVKSLLKDELNSAIQGLEDNVKNENQETKKDFLTIFGLFASFVTFLSIEVQVFKNRDNVFELLGISSISLSFVIYFALVLNYVAKDKNDWNAFKRPIYVFNLIFVFIGILFLYKGESSSIARLDSIVKRAKDDSINIEQLKINIIKLNSNINSLDSLKYKQMNHSEY